MAKYRKLPIDIDAVQWHQAGDHAAVAPFVNDTPGSTCAICGQAYSSHGWINTLEGGRIVCPLDWIVTGIAGEVYPVKPSIFAATYEASPV
jgi:hypothetical protein